MDGSLRLFIDNHCVTPLEHDLSNTKTSLSASGNFSVGVAPCQEGNPFQTWIYQNETLRPFKQTLLCMTARGSLIALEPCNGLDHQRWMVDYSHRIPQIAITFITSILAQILAIYMAIKILTSSTKSSSLRLSCMQIPRMNTFQWLRFNAVLSYMVCNANQMGMYIVFVADKYLAYWH